MSITSIASLMITREYAKKNVTLPAKFWNLVEYKPKYQLQMRLASKFIRTYGEQVVQNVLDREVWCFSLAAKRLPDLMELEMSRLKKVEVVNQPKQEETSAPNNVPVFRVPEKQKSLLDE